MVHQLIVHIINNRKSIDKFEEDDKYILNYVHASRFFHISIYFLGRHFGCLPSSARDQSNEMTIIAYLFKSRLRWWKVKQVLTAQSRLVYWLPAIHVFYTQEQKIWYWLIGIYHRSCCRSQITKRPRIRRKKVMLMLLSNDINKLMPKVLRSFRN